MTFTLHGITLYSVMWAFMSCQENFRSQTSNFQQGVKIVTWTFSIKDKYVTFLMEIKNCFFLCIIYIILKDSKLFLSNLT